jgi:hypothetical protein
VTILHEPRPRGHQESHAALVEFQNGINGTCAAIDAIIVPTARSARHLGPVADLARSVGCLLVVLCSARAKGPVVAELVTSLPGLRAAVVDLPPGYAHPLLDFQTSKHPHAGLAKHVDLSTKRNIGLLLARLLGWEQVLFVDDDIRGLDVSMLARASSLLGCYRAVGFRIGEYPDNSVVCHAHRLGGGNQGTFVGANALLADTGHANSFFPAVYNEDWLFLYDHVKSRAVVTAGTATQLDYDPFASPLRAASEEFGDMVAETLFWLLHGDIGVMPSDPFLWRKGLARRSAFVEDVIGRLLAMPSRESEHPLGAMKAVRARLDEILPEDCQMFVDAWREDLAAWSDRLLGLPSFATERRAFDYLDLPTVSLEVTQ